MIADSLPLLGERDDERVNCQELRQISIALFVGNHVNKRRRMVSSRTREHLLAGLRRDNEIHRYSTERNGSGWRFGLEVIEDVPDKV